MSTKPESRKQRLIRKHLESCFPKSFWIKIWSGPFQVSGFPDLLGCVEGLFFAFEVKMPGEQPSPVQVRMMSLITKAGGCTGVVYDQYEAEELIRSTLRASSRGL